MLIVVFQITYQMLSNMVVPLLMPKIKSIGVLSTDRSQWMSLGHMVRIDDVMSICFESQVALTTWNRYLKQHPFSG